MTAKLVRPVVVAKKDLPAVVETLAAGTIVEFDPRVHHVGLTDVQYDGQVYSGALRDLLDAAHPMEWR